MSYYRPKNKYRTIRSREQNHEFLLAALYAFGVPLLILAGLMVLDELKLTTTIPNFEKCMNFGKNINNNFNLLCQVFTSRLPSRFSPVPSGGSGFCFWGAYNPGAVWEMGGHLLTGVHADDFGGFVAWALSPKPRDSRLERKSVATIENSQEGRCNLCVETGMYGMEPYAYKRPAKWCVVWCIFHFIS